MRIHGIDNMSMHNLLTITDYYLYDIEREMYVYFCVNPSTFVLEPVYRSDIWGRGYSSMEELIEAVKHIAADSLHLEDALNMKWNMIIIVPRHIIMSFIEAETLEGII